SVDAPSAAFVYHRNSDPLCLSFSIPSDSPAGLCDKTCGAANPTENGPGVSGQARDGPGAGNPANSATPATAACGEPRQPPCGCAGDYGYERLRWYVTCW